MLALLAALSLHLAPAPDFNALAQARNADGLLAVSGPEVKALPRPFNFLRINGPYDTGRFGWTAVPLSTPNGEKFVVFSTKITSEDYGEFVFATDGQKLTKYVPEPDSLGYRIDHQKLDIRFDIPNKTAILSSLASIRRTGPEKKGFFVRMSPQYKVSAVTDEASKKVPYAQAGGVVWIKSAGKPAFKYRFDYKGVVDLPQYAGSITSKEVLLTNDYWYPMIARLPSTYEATIHVQRGWTSIGQGELVSDKETAIARVMTWKMDLPVVYWSLSVGPFKQFVNTINRRKYSLWGFNITEEQARIQAEQYAPLVEWYDKNLAPYPFSTWGAVLSPQYGGGALEAYSFATYGGGPPGEDGHETGHTWFGGIINNTYLKSLWNESFAVYCDALVQRELGIGNREERREAFVDDAAPNQSYASMAMANSGVFAGPASAALGYGKGAKVLQMLEIELGTNAMITAMRRWLKTHPKGQPGEWEDFEKAASKSSGKNLRTFFDEWVRRSGWADFEIEGLRWEGGKVLGEAVFKGSAYHLACEVLLQNASGKQEFKLVRFEPTGNRAAFSIDATTKPALVSFDPWRKLLRRYGADEAPIVLSSALRGVKKYTAPAKAKWMTQVRGQTLEDLPTDLKGVLLVGTPETTPVMKALCERAGFVVAGDKLTYEGTTIDLNKGGAMAVVDLPSGGKTIIGLGTTLGAPRTGRARLVVVDELGRILRAKTDPKITGFLTYRL